MYSLGCVFGREIQPQIVFQIYGPNKGAVLGVRVVFMLPQMVTCLLTKTP